MRFADWIMGRWGQKEVSSPVSSDVLYFNLTVTELQRRLREIENSRRDQVPVIEVLSKKIDDLKDANMVLNMNVVDLRKDLAVEREQNVSIRARMAQISEVLDLCHSRENGKCIEGCFACQFKETNAGLKMAKTMMRP